MTHIIVCVFFYNTEKQTSVKTNVSNRNVERKNVYATTAVIII